MYENEEQYTENKLLLLFVLDRLKIPVTDLYFNEIMLEPGMVNYFTIQTALGELVSHGCIDRILDSGGIPMYALAEKGREILRSLEQTIPYGVRARYVEIVTKNRAAIKRQMEVNAICFEDEQQNYYVRCFIREGLDRIVDIKVPVASKKDAGEICAAWQKNPSKIYVEIMRVLYENK